MKAKVGAANEGFPSYFPTHLHIRAVVFMLYGDLKNLPEHSFNTLIILVPRDCLPNYFSVLIFFPLEGVVGWCDGAG